MRLGTMTSKQKNISVAVFNQSAPTSKNKEHQQGIFTQLTMNWKEHLRGSFHPTLRLVYLPLLRVVNHN